MKDLAFQFQKDNWYVYSWEEGATMFYRKQVVDKSIISTFEISYPSVDEALYDATVDKLYKSFKPAPEEEAQTSSTAKKSRSAYEDVPVNCAWCAGEKGTISQWAHGVMFTCGDCKNFENWEDGYNIALKMAAVNEIFAEDTVEAFFGGKGDGQCRTCNQYPIFAVYDKNDNCREICIACGVIKYY